MSLLLTVIQPFQSYVVGQDISDPSEQALILATNPQFVVQTDSGRTPAPAPPAQTTSGVLVANTFTTAYEPIPYRVLYLELTGAGRVVGGVIYRETESGGFAPNMSSAIQYDGSIQTDGVRIPVSNDQPGKSLKFKPGAITGGSVNYAWSN